MIKVKKIFTTFTSLLLLICFFNITTTTAEYTSYNDCWLTDGEVTPTVGREGAKFRFQVTYHDVEEVPLSSKTLWIKIKSYLIPLPIEMKYVEGSSNDGGATYKVDLILKDPGVYPFYFYFSNNNGESVRFPESENEFLSVKVIDNNVVENYAVIICGGTQDDKEDHFERSATRAYDTFKKLGYKDENIFYLSKDTNDRGVDDYLDRESIKYVFKTLLMDQSNKNSKCFIYMVDHGSDSGAFFIDKGTWINAFEIGDWLKNLKYKSLTVLIECCFSGLFIDHLSGDNRIVITSTDRDSVSYSHQYIGECLFSKEFFEALEDGKSYGEAWEEADKYISESIPDEHYKPLISIKDEKDLLNILDDKETQNPQIDDNGDQIGHGTHNKDDLPIGGDGNFALQTYPGYNSINRNIVIPLKLDRFNILLNKIFEKLELFKL